jgi:hypothetical protein
MLLSIPAYGGEYYIWTDESGNTVITNNAANLPESPSSHVTIRSYEDRSSAPVPGMPNTAPTAEVDEVTAVPSAHASVPNVAHPRILLDTPDSSIFADYTWVPLLQPVYLGSTPFNGFWCLRSIRSPFQAFRDYLNGQGWTTAQPGLWSSSPSVFGSSRRHRRFWAPSGSRSGNQVYDQVLGEIQGMQAQIGAQISQGNAVYDQVLRERSTHTLPSGSASAPATHGSAPARTR